MKKLYTLALAAFGFAAISFGQDQYDLSITLTGPEENENVAPNAAQPVAFTLSNVGDGDVPDGNAIWITFLLGQANFSWDGTAGQVDGVQFQGAFEAGESVTSAQLQAGLFQTPLVYDTDAVTQLTPACVAVIGADADGSTLQDMAQNGDPNDADNDNNAQCFFVDPALNVVDLTLTDDVEVNILTNSLEITSTAVEAFDYMILSMDGRTVATGKVQGSEIVNTSDYKNGAYILTVYNNNEKKVVKFGIAK